MRVPAHWKLSVELCAIKLVKWAQAIWISSCISSHCDRSDYTLTLFEAIYIGIYKQITPLYNHSSLDQKGRGQCESQTKKGYIHLATSTGKYHICIRCSYNRGFFFFAGLARNPEQITPYFTGTNRLPGCGWNSLRFDSDVWEAATTLRYAHSKVTTYVGHTKIQYTVPI